MNNQQNALLKSIDDTSKLLTDLVINGVKIGIPQNVMEAHCRAYFTVNIGKELYRMFQKKEVLLAPELFSDKDKS